MVAKQGEWEELQRFEQYIYQYETTRRCHSRYCRNQTLKMWTIWQEFSNYNKIM